MQPTLERESLHDGRRRPNAASQSGNLGSKSESERGKCSSPLSGAAHRSVCSADSTGPALGCGLLNIHCHAVRHSLDGVV